MIKQYPYQLEVLLTVDNGTDPNGNNLPPSDDWTFLCNCRDEAGNGRLINGVDGQAIAFSFLIQMPKGVDAIEEGSKVRVIDESGAIRCEGSVIYSRKDQLHSRAWV